MLLRQRSPAGRAGVRSGAGRRQWHAPGAESGSAAVPVLAGAAGSRPVAGQRPCPHRPRRSAAGERRWPPRCPPTGRCCAACRFGPRQRCPPGGRRSGLPVDPQHLSSPRCRAVPVEPGYQRLRSGVHVRGRPRPGIPWACPAAPRAWTDPANPCRGDHRSAAQLGDHVGFGLAPWRALRADVDLVDRRGGDLWQATETNRVWNRSRHQLASRLPQRTSPDGDRPVAVTGGQRRHRSLHTTLTATPGPVAVHAGPRAQPQHRAGATRSRPLGRRPGGPWDDEGRHFLYGQAVADLRGYFSVGALYRYAQGEVYSRLFRNDVTELVREPPQRSGHQPRLQPQRPLRRRTPAPAQPAATVVAGAGPGPPLAGCGRRPVPGSDAGAAGPWLRRRGLARVRHAGRRPTAGTARPRIPLLDRPLGKVVPPRRLLWQGWRTWRDEASTRFDQGSWWR